MRPAPNVETYNHHHFQELCLACPTNLHSLPSSRSPSINCQINSCTADGLDAPSAVAKLKAFPQRATLTALTIAMDLMDPDNPCMDADLGCFLEELSRHHTVRQCLRSVTKVTFDVSRFVFF